MKLCVIGLGYVGFPAAVIFASKGFRVVGVDVYVEKIMALNKGKLPFKEPGLSEILVKVVKDGMLNFSRDISSSVRFSDIVI